MYSLCFHIQFMSFHDDETFSHYIIARFFIHLIHIHNKKKTETLNEEINKVSFHTLT